MSMVEAALCNKLQQIAWASCNKLQQIAWALGLAPTECLPSDCLGQEPANKTPLCQQSTQRHNSVLHR